MGYLELEKMPYGKIGYELFESGARNENTLEYLEGEEIYHDTHIFEKWSLEKCISTHMAPMSWRESILYTPKSRSDDGSEDGKKSSLPCSRWPHDKGYLSWWHDDTQI
jgi:hypothetical protein